jgi:hypothetical protein
MRKHQGRHVHSDCRNVRSSRALVDFYKFLHFFSWLWYQDKICKTNTWWQGKRFIFVCMTMKTVCVSISLSVIQYSPKQCLQNFIYTIQSLPGMLLLTIRYPRCLPQFTRHVAIDDKISKVSTTSLTVWKKFLIFSCSGFTVFSSNGNLEFRVNNYPWDPKDEVFSWTVNGPFHKAYKNIYYLLTEPHKVDENIYYLLTEPL